VLASLRGDPARTHAERLPADLERVLEAAGLRLPEIDVFGVAAGPGSFTGLRVGIATIQGLAFALGKKVVGIGVLDVLGQLGAGWDGSGASSGRPAGTAIGVAMDAQRREVFSARFRVTEPAGPAPAALECLDGSAAEPPAATAARWARAAPDVLVGDGALLYRAVFREHLGDTPTVEPLPPLAPLIAALAERAAHAGLAVAPHAVKPVYVRRPDAELARNRSAANLPAKPGERR
jgi:tRNA threonylcarbamoyladenosine biosynthesis protein TsaB